MTTCETVNGRRRHHYDSEGRRQSYLKHRDATLRRLRDDRARCPLCHMDYRRLYLPQHMARRHNICDNM